MKRLFLVFMATVAITSCTTTYNVTSFEEYNKNIETVKSDLAGKGYNLSGHNRESSSNTVVTGTAYTTQAGFGTAMGNDYYTYDTYSFSNANGDVAEIMLKYRDRYSSSLDMNYMSTVELLGCKTSKASDYDKICGDNSAVKPLLRNMYKDAYVKVYDGVKTWILIDSILLGGLIIMMFSLY